MDEQLDLAPCILDEPVSAVDLVLHCPWMLRANALKAIAPNDAMIGFTGCGRFSCGSGRVGVGNDIPPRETLRQQSTDLIGIGLLDGQLIPDVDRIANTARKNASHDRHVEVSAP